MEITGVRVTGGDGPTDYPYGRGFAFDGFGDLLITDAAGRTVAMRKRPTFDGGVELTYAPPPPPTP